jgi:hypothetical protein
MRLPAILQRQQSRDKRASGSPGPRNRMAPDSMKRRVGVYSRRLAIEIDEDAAVPTPGNPVQLLTLTGNFWDVSRDGQQFLVSQFFGATRKPSRRSASS